MIKVFTTYDFSSGKSTTMIYDDEGHKIYQDNSKFEADYDTVYMFGRKLYTLESVKEYGTYFIFVEYDNGIKGLLSKRKVTLK